MKALGVIPARYASTRFPGKPLADINGKTMIQRVYERASATDLLQEVIVATDDERIESEVLKFGGKVVMTAKDHPTGTERVFEVVSKLPDTFDVVVNIQGDEPYIHSEQIDALVEIFDDPMIDIATLAKKIDNPTFTNDPNVVKVVCNPLGFALYFSRQAIPYDRKENNVSKHLLKHIGLYAFRPEMLEEIVKLKPGILEKCESLEQLRWLENGYQVFVLLTELESHGVDTPEDLSKFANIT